MKNLILSLLTAFTFGYTVQAQENQVPTMHGKMQLVTKAGFTVSSQSLRYAQDMRAGSKGGFTLGAGLNIPATNTLSLQPEVLYVQKGKKSYDLKSNTFYKRNINYLEVPFLCKLTFGDKAIKYYAMAGPSLGLALNGRESFKNTEKALDVYDIKFGEEPSDADTKYYHPKFYNQVDFGMQLSGGLNIPFGSGTIQAEARYGLGLNNFHKRVSEGNLQIQADGKNRTFALTVGYALPIGK